MPALVRLPTKTPARATAPPPPRPQSATDPLAETTKEWRENERAKADARQSRERRAVLALTAILLAGGFWAFPLVYAWKGLCLRWPRLRPWGVLLGVPAIGAALRWWDAVLGPTWALVTLPSQMYRLERTIAFSYPWVSARILRPADAVPGQIAVSGVELVRSWEPGTGPNPLPLLKEVAVVAWPTGLALAGGLIAAWGLAELLAGRKLRARSPGAIMQAAQRAIDKAGGKLDVVQGMVLRGYITLLFGPSGGGKTEVALGMISASMRAEDEAALFCGRKIKRAKWYYAIEQPDENFAPYLADWGLTDAVTQGRLKIVTRSEVSALWHAHGHEAAPDWMDLAPLLLDDAGRWGADVFVLDTLLEWSGATDNLTIRRHMGPITSAVSTWGYAFLAISHTNKDGGLLGGTAFWKLCDVVLKMEMLFGQYDPRRRLCFEKDRTRNRVPFLDIRRDMDAKPPCYRLVGDNDATTPAPPTPPAGTPTKKTRITVYPVPPLSLPTLPAPTGTPANVIDLASVRSRAGKADGGVGGVMPGREQRTNEPNERTLSLAEDNLLTVLRPAGAAGVSTVELGRVLGIEKNRLHRLVTKMKADGLIEKAGKDGKAATWRCVGVGAAVAGEKTGEGA